MSEVTTGLIPGLNLQAGNNSEHPYDRQVLPTPFHTRTAEHCRTNAWTEWSGFTVVSVYDDVTSEYTAIRNAAALCDVSPRIKYRIGGPQAAAYLDRLIAGPVSQLAPGRSLHAVICDDAGKVIANGHLFHIETGRYALFVDHPFMDWLTDSAFGFGVEIGCITNDLAALAVQGPTSCAVLLSAGFHGLDRLEPGRVSRYEVRGMPVLVSRTGHTGDLGYELWLDPEDAPIIWDRIMDGGSLFGVMPSGRDASEIARIEAGLVRAGSEYVSPLTALNPDDTCTALELGLSDQLDMGGSSFNGRSALLREAERGPFRHLAGFEALSAQPLRPSRISGPRGLLGRVTSSTWCPRLSRTIGFALLNRADISGLQAVALTLEYRDPVEKIDAAIKCQLTEGAFFEHLRAKATPPRAY